MVTKTILIMLLFCGCHQVRGYTFSLHLLAVVGIVMLRASAPVRWATALNYAASCFLDCTANRKNVDLIHLGVACEPGSHSPCYYHSVQTSA
jgi:hypothetical protein